MAATDEFIRNFLASIIRPDQRLFEIEAGGRRLTYSIEQIVKILPRLINQLEPNLRDRVAPLLVGKQPTELIPFLYSAKNTNKTLLEFSNPSTTPQAAEEEALLQQTQDSSLHPAASHPKAEHPEPSHPSRAHPTSAEGHQVGAETVAILTTPLQKNVSTPLKRLGNTLGTFAARNPRIAQSLLFGGAMGALGLVTSGFNPVAAATFAAGGALAPHWKRFGLGKMLGGLGSGIIQSTENILSNRPRTAPASGNEEQSNDGGDQGEGRRDSRPKPGLPLRRFPISPFWLWVIGGLILVVAFILLLSGQGDGKVGDSKDPLSPKNLEITKIGPDQVENDQEITYKITVKYIGDRTASIVVNDQLPQGTKFVDTDSKPAAQPSCTTKLAGVASGSTESGQNISWTLSDLAPQTSTELCLTLLPTEPDVYIVNTVTAMITSVSGEASSDIGFDMTGPSAVPNIDTPISYALTLTYKGNGTGTFEVYDQIPEHTKFLDADSKDGCESQLAPIETTGTVKWTGISLKKGESLKLCLTLQPVDDIVKIANRARAVLVSQTGNDLFTAITFPPNDDTCEQVVTGLTNQYR